jgi:4-hydroxy-2-oxoheptanedioate aldolase
MTHKTISLYDKLRSGVPTFGFASYIGSAPIIEIAGNWGFDFAFIDAEHTTAGIDQQTEKLIMAGLLAGVAPIVRVRGTIDWEIRKSLELGAAGILIPQVHDADQMRLIVEAARFPPLGRRGADGSVRSASFGGPTFDWSRYIDRSNRESLVIPMAESFEFFDNIDAILEVEGIDIVSFGPLDFALSKGLSTDGLLTNPEIIAALETLISKCHARNIKVMSPGLPASTEGVTKLLEMGVDMIILGTDVLFLNQGFQQGSEIFKAVLR